MKSGIKWLVCAVALSAVSALGQVQVLDNGRLRVELTWEEGLRLAALRWDGGENLLRTRAQGGQYSGFRTWLMGPSDLPDVRAMLSEVRGELEVIDRYTVELRTVEETAWGLGLEWRVELARTAPELRIVQRVSNRGTERRYVGIWSLAVFTEGTTLTIPYERTASVPAGYPHAVYVFPWMNLADGRIASDAEGVRLQLRRGPEAGPVKLGLVQKAGRYYAERGGVRWEFTAPYESDALYPEGGANVTVYASPANGVEIMGEGEVMGPLVILDPGQTTTLTQTVRVVE